MPSLLSSSALERFPRLTTATDAVGTFAEFCGTIAHPVITISVMRPQKICPRLGQRRLGACESASGVVSDWVAGCSPCLGWTCMELLPLEESCSASPYCHEEDT